MRHGPPRALRRTILPDGSRPWECEGFVHAGGSNGRLRRKAPEPAVDGRGEDARLIHVDVVLRKLGKGSRAVAGRLVRAPRKGSVVVIEFPDGMHEYVTTPVKRVLRIAGREIFYIETINSRYRLEVRGREEAVAESTG